MDLMALEIQIDVYIIDMSYDNKYLGLKEIGKPLRKIIDTRNNKLYLLIYLLVILTLIY